MASEKKGGLGTAAAGLLRPTTQPEPIKAETPIAPPALVVADEEEQGGDAVRAEQDVAQPEGRTIARSFRRRKAPAASTAKLEGRRLYLSESTHFRLRMLAYQRGRNLSEVAEELLDKALPKWDINRVG